MAGSPRQLVNMPEEYEDGVLDYGFDGGNVVPWGPPERGDTPDEPKNESEDGFDDSDDSVFDSDGGNVEPHGALSERSVPEYPDYNPPTIRTATNQPLTALQSLQLEMVMYDAYYAVEPDSEWMPTTNYDPSAIRTATNQPLTALQSLQLEQVMYDAYYAVKPDLEWVPTTKYEATTTTTFQGDHQSHIASFPFFNLPLELRQNVYGWIHLMNPIKLRQLTPRLVTSYQHCTKYFTPWYSPKALEVPGAVPGIIANTPEGAASSPSYLLSSDRPFAGLPTALLQANRQTYLECRALPFEANEFLFCIWKSSGLFAAGSFLKDLRPWQREAMRFARLELLTSDLTGGDAQWNELCEDWGLGLVELRLKISHSQRLAGTRPLPWIKNAKGVTQPCIEDGLKLMKRLRYLEVEREYKHRDHKKQLEWCKNLSEALSEDKTDADWRVEVTYVESTEA
ncbi:Uu.00g033360.m01.CDS01 [Anthostomella pinea]|uniref:Uu.00g033360.m01.CDS01 n=1 Tax=Anthostomella pinea TaxID=933095 RepID=A0AAI8V3Z4_9PEZI|nr:Uu.00g033360.m01.CDS01 [Anthostomella pinea]